MAERHLIDCHCCGAMIAREARTCPHCGQPRDHLLPATGGVSPAGHAFALAFWVWFVAGAVLVIVMLAALPGPWLGTLALGLSAWMAGAVVLFLAWRMARP